MLLENVLTDPLSSLQHMERYVNDGSPSGFSEKFTTSPSTSPFGDGGCFRLVVLRMPAPWFRSKGRLPAWMLPPADENHSYLLAHPDMKGHPQLAHTGIEQMGESTFSVLPTASGRTVQCQESREPDYIKLHYDGILGRMNRRLGLANANSSYEIARAMGTAVDNGRLPQEFAFLPENAYRIASVPNKSCTHDWGMVRRSHTPHARPGVTPHALIPAFALFSQDKKNPTHRPLLHQLIEVAASSPSSAFLETVLRPILACYFGLLKSLGLQSELNAQNVLFGLDESGAVIAIVLRDLESVDKDLPLMQELGITGEFSDLAFKTLRREQYDYQIRHSLMFDFKCGEYLLAPLIESFSRLTGDEKQIPNQVRQIVDTLTTGLPKDFFPENKWYGHARTMIDRTSAARPYIEQTNPKFRSR